MGMYRFLLALAVLIAHTDFAPQSFGLGTAAVVSFFILSGYVMTLLVERYYASPDRVLLFYLDRAARIFPQFLLYLSIAILLVSQHGIGFGFAASCSPGDAVLNALALPLSWSQQLGLHCQYIPQAWSIGLELSFYLLVPWLLWWVRLIRWATALSFVTFGAALLGIVDTDAYAYRTLPGTLFMFLVGMSFARPVLLGRWFPHLVWGGALVSLAVLFARGVTGNFVGTDVLIGLLVGVPLVGLVQHWRSNELDALLGDLSYGIFLNHLLVMNVLQQIAGIRIDSHAALGMLIVISMAASLLTYRLIEWPVLNLRHALRGMRVVTQSPALRAARDDVAA